MEMKKLFQIGTPLCGILFGVVGALIALAMLFLGFWKTLLVMAFFAVGYLLGAFGNKKEAVQAAVERLSHKDN